MNKILIILSLCFSNLLSININYLGYWERSNGPFGGFVSDILVHEDTLFCATHAGLYKKQGSMSWKFIGFGNLSIREIAKNDFYIYAAGNSGCYRYNLITEEIEELYSGSIQSIAAIDSIVFLGSGYYPGIYKSVDYGETWEESIKGIDNYDIEKIFITESKTILASAAGASGSGVFRSTDFGVTWSRIDSNKYAWKFQGICQQDNKLYGYDYTNYAKVYVSENDGLTWQSKGAPADHIYAIFINNSGLYTGTSRTGIFKSNDYGLSWSKINNGITNNDIFSLSGNNDVIYAGSYGGIFSSTNFTSWENETSGLTNSRVNSIIKVNNMLFGATHGSGIHISTDNGESWRRIESNLTKDYITDMINIGNTIYIIASDNWLAPFGGSIYKSTDNGNSWTKRSSGFDTGLLEKIAGNNEFILVGTEYGLFRSTNGGNSWSKILNGVENNINISDVDVLGSTAIVLNGTSNIYRSVDYGSSWQSYQLSGLVNGSTVKVINSDYYISSGSVNRIFKSTDNGESWTLISGVPSGNYSVNTFTGKDNNIYAGLSGGVLISNNYGNTWESANINLEVTDIISIYYSNNTLLAGTNGGGVFKFASAEDPIIFSSPSSNTINKNNIIFSWNQHVTADNYRFQISESPSFNNTMIDTIIDNTSFKVENLQYGNIYYYRVGTVNEFWDDNFSLTYSIKIDLPLTIQLDQNFPNPFNSKTSIVYHLPERCIIELVIYDTTGKKISTLLNTIKDSGSHTFVYETSSLASGVYFYQIKNKDKMVTKKFVLIK